MKDQPDLFLSEEPKCIDLDAVEERYQNRAKGQWIPLIAADIPALIAEVKRLRRAHTILEREFNRAARVSEQHIDVLKAEIKSSSGQETTLSR